MTDLSEYERTLVKNIDEYGWQATHVFDPDGVNEAFSYSIGFRKSLNTADFIIFGLPKNLMHHILWEIYRRIDTGKTVRDGAEWEGLLEGDYTCVSRLVHSSHNLSNYFNSARWYYRYIGMPDDDLEFYQLFWPGAKIKKLPWEEGCHPDVITAQPLLYEP